jgi:AAA domain/CHC2 zinc finger
MQLTFEQIRAYFEHRHPGQRIQSRAKVSVKCIFHDDRTPSCTLYLDGAGGFHCNGCNVGGNLFQFEARFSNCSLAEAEGKVAEITGAKPSFGSSAKLGPVVASYDYRDNDGRVLFQKQKYKRDGQAKTFRVRHPDGKGGWSTGIDPQDGKTKRVLYNQPLLVASNMAIACEGEKDCDTVAQCGLFSDRGSLRFATTCNFDGAWKPGESSKWLKSYNPYFAGKFVVIFADNDESGETWAQAVAYNVEPYAYQVKIVRLPGLPEKGDVSDWLQTHTAKELEAQISTAPAWQPEKPQHAYDQDAVEFAAEAPANVDWLVEDLIPRGSAGIFGGVPKATKSLSALDMCMSLSCGVSWLGLKISARVKTYLVSREDAPGLTQRRIKQLIAGRADYRNLSDWMRITTRRHVADLEVTSEEHLGKLIERIRAFGAELVILDVFRKLYKGDENDNEVMDAVLEKVNRIRSETGAAIALVHHIRKAETADIFSGLRGAGVIFGWMEWGVGIRVLNPEEKDRSKWIREMEFESKESTLEPITYHVVSSPDHATLRLEITTRPQKSKVKAARAAELLEVPTDWQQRHDLQRESRA